MRTGAGRLRRWAEQAPARAPHHAHLFSGRHVPVPVTRPGGVMRGAAGRSWSHNAGINNGRIFRWTCAGVATLPTRVSYAIGWMGTAIAYRAMGDVSRALAENLQRV